MLGKVAPKAVPANIGRSVDETFKRLKQTLGPVRFEWVFDGQNIWIVQLHKGGTKTDIGVIVPGQPKHWVRFDVEKGLESLRTLLAELGEDGGVIVEGQVGLTSHVADLLRKAKKPAKLEAVPRQLHFSVV